MAKFVAPYALDPSCYDTINTTPLYYNISYKMAYIRHNMPLREWHNRAAGARVGARVRARARVHVRVSVCARTCMHVRMGACLRACLHATCGVCGGGGGGGVGGRG